MDSTWRPRYSVPGWETPASSSTVGAMSMTVAKAEEISPRRVKPGQLTNPATRIPPSLVNALYRRDGAVAACAQRGPYQMNEFGAPRFSTLLSQYFSI